MAIDFINRQSSISLGDGDLLASAKSDGFGYKSESLSDQSDDETGCGVGVVLLGVFVGLIGALAAVVFGGNALNALLVYSLGGVLSVFCVVTAIAL
jgi:hypothetical protein